MESRPKLTKTERIAILGEKRTLQLEILRDNLYFLNDTYCH